MKRFYIIVELYNGDKINAYSVGESAKDAEIYLLSQQVVKDFAKAAPIKRVTSKEVEFDAWAECDFYFKPSALKPGFYVVTDKRRLILLTYEGHNYSNQHISFIEPEKINESNWLTVATSLRQIGEFVQRYHADTL